MSRDIKFVVAIQQCPRLTGGRRAELLTMLMPIRAIKQKRARNFVSRVIQM